MKEKLVKIWNTIIHSKIAMCITVFVLFLLYMLFLSDYDLINRFKMRHKIAALEKEIERYEQMTKQDEERIEELKGNDESLEKFARERYHMRKDNEDIFVVEEE